MKNRWRRGAERHREVVTQVTGKGVPDGWQGPVVGSEKMQEGRQREKLVRVC